MDKEKTSPLVKPTLGLLGATINAMALIAPGAFLWITYQLQAAATDPSGASVATDIWAGIVVALIVALLTALSYSQLAKIYPEAGFASVTYFAEKAFLDQKGASKRAAPTSLARLAKLATGWSAHLFYWVYPGVMVAMMALLIGYIYTQFTDATLLSHSSDSCRRHLRYPDRLHRLSRCGWLNQDIPLDKRDPTRHARPFQRPGHLVSHQQSANGNHLGLQRCLGRH